MECSIITYLATRREEALKDGIIVITTGVVVLSDRGG